MTTYLLYGAAALYLGLLTSISPCPLATNIAAISYIGRKVQHPRKVLAAGALYTLGRCLLYLLLASLLMATALSSRSVSLFFQRYIHLALGPIFIVLGIVLLGLVTIGGGGTLMNDRIQRRVDAMGIWGALFLGMLFAASFCPTSAAWFFGLLALLMGSQAEAVTTVLARVGLVLPEQVVGGALILLPTVYGIGSAVPVLLVAALLAYSAQAVGKTYNVLARMEWWARMATGWLFVGLGLYFTLHYVFEVPIGRIERG